MKKDQLIAKYEARLRIERGDMNAVPFYEEFLKDLRSLEAGSQECEEEFILNWKKVSREDFVNCEKPQAQECECKWTWIYSTGEGTNSYCDCEIGREMDRKYMVKPQEAEWVVEAIMKEMDGWMEWIDVDDDKNWPKAMIYWDRVERILRKHLWVEKKEENKKENYVFVYHSYNKSNPEFVEYEMYTEDENGNRKTLRKEKITPTCDKWCA